MLATDQKYFTSTHEWVSAQDDGTFKLGISSHAQSLLGDVVFVELPVVGNKYAAGESLAVIESVKTAADVYMPLTGVISAINENLAATPELVNQSAEESGWLWCFQPDNAEELMSLLSQEQYQELCGESS